MNDAHLIATIMDDSWLTMDQLAHICRVETAWLQYHLDEGLFPHAESVSGTWRFSDRCLLRARRMYQLERDFDAVPELAALMADMQEELDALRKQLRAMHQT
ncbi:MAG TPA: chaperone modulator CbpM [Steroidobacteraceae bacterium]|nr:chaperone modulator CbpM [Steroidobacteraceae bacterium]